MPSLPSYERLVRSLVGSAGVIALLATLAAPLAVSAAPLIPPKPVCADKWIDAAYAALYGMGHKPSRIECNVDRYAGGVWDKDPRGNVYNGDDAKFDRLKKLVASSEVCNDPWIGEIFENDLGSYNHKPSVAECQPGQYGHWGPGYNGYRELFQFILAHVSAGHANPGTPKPVATPVATPPPPTHTAPPATTLSCNIGSGTIPKDKLLVVNLTGGASCRIDVRQIAKVTEDANNVDFKTLAGADVKIPIALISSASFNGTTMTKAQMLQILTLYLMQKH